MSRCDNQLGARTVEYRVRSCIGFLGNRSGGLRTGNRAHPRVADRGALYRGLLLNTVTKLNKQSRTIFQEWSRSNNPQAKVLTTVLRAAWHLGLVTPAVFPGNQVTSCSTQNLPLHAGLCRGGPYTSLANRGKNMEKNDLNKSMCEELFGGKLEVTVVPDCFEKYDAKQQKNYLYGML